MGDDDFGDFAGFSTANSVNKEQNSFSNDKPTNNGFPNFSNFDMDLGSDKFCVAGGVPFEIPSLPSSPTDPATEGPSASNIHTADGVSFDIPPLPDFSSLDIPIEDLGLPGDSKTFPVTLLPHSAEEKPNAGEGSPDTILVSEPVQGLKSSVLSTTVVSFPSKPDDNEFGGFSAFSTAPMGANVGILPPNLDGEFSVGPVLSSENTASASNATNSFKTYSAKPPENRDGANTDYSSFMGEEFGGFSSGFVGTSTEPVVPISSNMGQDEEKSANVKHVASDSKRPETKSATLDSNIDSSNDLNASGTVSDVVTDTLPPSDFGGFESFSLPAASSTADSQFGNFAISFPDTSASSSNPEDVPPQGGFGNFASFPASTRSEEAGGMGDFGNFSSFDVVVTSATSASSFNPEDMPPQGGFGNFASFPASTRSEEAEGMGDFGNFSSFDVAVTSASDSNNEGELRKNEGTGSIGTNGTGTGTAVTKESKDEFGDFGSFSGPSAASSAATKPKDSEDEFGDFGSFSGPSAASSVATKPKDSEDEFGDFGSFSGPSTATTTVPEAKQSDGELGDFGTFTGPKADEGTIENKEFGDFGSFAGPPTTTTTTTTTAASNSSKGAKTILSDDFGEFGGFSTSSKAVSSAATTETAAGLGALRGQGEAKSVVTSGGGDDFGEFGGFSSTSGAPSGFTPSGSVPKSSGASKHISEEHVSKVFQSCFLNGGKRADTSERVQHVPLKSLNKILQNQPNEKQVEALKSVWLVLQGCIDLTVPLHKFDRSCLQDNYYSTLNVNPKLESRPTTLSVLTGMAKFEDPLGGTTAMEDLRESFGFEGDLPELGSPTSPTGGKTAAGGFRRSSVERGPALLDLSLPLSPKQKEEASFTLTADLADLDLNPSSKKHKAKQLTSIEQLHINERLVVNRSTWVDSQLADLGDGKGSTTSSDDRTAQLDTLHGSKKTVEVQLQELGLDVSKTTLPKGKPGELSLSARTLLGRLPDLSFMLLTDKIEDKTNYARGYS